MSWLRIGDNAGSNPIVLRVRAFLRQCMDMVLERDVIANELFGFATRCATLAASHKTDYVVGYGTAFEVGQGRTDRLLGLAVQAGYMELLPEEVNGEPLYAIVDDPAFIHMIKKAEEEWEKQRRADVANPALCVPIRIRDGDACRYCGNIVIRSGDKKSGRYGTYDHREPGKAATVETMVVACGGCNKARGDAVDADDRHPLQPAPFSPYYTEQTLSYLRNNQTFVPPHIKEQLHLTPAAASRAGRTRSTDDSDPAASRGPRPATPQPAGQRTSADTTVSGAPVQGARSADPADPGCAGSGFTGSGRDGTGSGSRSVPGRAAGSRRRRGSRGGGKPKPR